MAQINFSIGMHEIAVEFAKKAIETSKGNIVEYSSWLAIFQYFIYINYKSDNYKSTKVETAFLNCENAALGAFTRQQDNFALMYLILILSCDKLALQKTHKGMHNSTLKPPANYASKIMKRNKYMGYIAWAEIYLRDKKKFKLGNDVLNDLISEYPKHPHAYLRKWRKEFDCERYLDSIEPMEDLFLKEEEMHSIPELKIIIALLYSKSLVKTNQYVLA